MDKSVDEIGELKQKCSLTVYIVFW